MGLASKLLRPGVWSPEVTSPLPDRAGAEAPYLLGKDSQLLDLVCYPKRYPERLQPSVDNVDFHKYLIIMATPAGFEPATSRLEGECSIQLSYGVT